MSETSTLVKATTTRLAQSTAQSHHVSCKGLSDDLISKHPFLYAKKPLHKQPIPVYRISHFSITSEVARSPPEIHIFRIIMAPIRVGIIGLSSATDNISISPGDGWAARYTKPIDQKT